ncbi:SLOG family protein [Streptomyces sp. NPDC087850]|uniref:SLOG family protein n=1 Tax=Streptomyces sp. NPDC087850 TaxID=3365809 RepID=UPI0037FCBC49
MNDRPYRILITGSRDWDDYDLIHAALTFACFQQVPAVIVHGACPTGADALASRWVHRHRAIGLSEELHPAMWRWHGRAAGPRRNAHMVHLGADITLAFIRNRSRGATGCADLAEAAGIPVKRWTV